MPKVRKRVIIAIVVALALLLIPFFKVEFKEDTFPFLIKIKNLDCSSSSARFYIENIGSRAVPAGEATFTIRDKDGKLVSQGKIEFAELPPTQSSFYELEVSLVAREKYSIEVDGPEGTKASALCRVS